MITTTPALLLTALLSLFQHMPARRCLEARRDTLAAHIAEASNEYGVPPEILVSIGWYESWLACHPGEHSYGAPIDRRHRHTAGTMMHTASALAWGYRRCGTWPGAIRHFRVGLCSGGRIRGYDERDAMRLVERLRSASQ